MGDGNDHGGGYVETIKDRFSRSKERLGSGSYKTVYKGFDHETGCEIAWNQIKFERLKTSERTRLEDEINILSSINHGNIINFYDFYIDHEKKRIIFITELMTSGTLRQFVLKKRGEHSAKLKVIKRWCVQILKGLVYLHSQNIIHRDLKCDNIFINGSTGDVKIGDLGLSTVMTKTHAESVIGTPEFMAPEVYDEHYTEKVDTYAFGMCVLEMISQEYPYSECTNAAQIYKKVTSGKPPASLLRIEDPNVREFIELCIGPYEDRPSPQELLLHSFFRIANGEAETSADKAPVRLVPKEVPDKAALVLMNTRSPATQNGVGANGVSANGVSANGISANGISAHTSSSTHVSGASSTSVKPVTTGSDAASVASTVDLSQSEVVAVEETSTSTSSRTNIICDVVVSPSPRKSRPESGSISFAEPEVGSGGGSGDVTVVGSEAEDSVVSAKLQLLIGDTIKEVTFPYDLKKDTSLDVAQEMKLSMNTSIDVGWLAQQIEERVEELRREQGVELAEQGHGQPPDLAADTHHRAMIPHDSPRICAVTVDGQGDVVDHTELMPGGVARMSALRLPSQCSLAGIPEDMRGGAVEQPPPDDPDDREVCASPRTPQNGIIRVPGAPDEQHRIDKQSVLPGNFALANDQTRPVESHPDVVSDGSNSLQAPAEVPLSEAPPQFAPESKPTSDDQGSATGVISHERAVPSGKPIKNSSSDPSLSMDTCVGKPMAHSSSDPSFSQHSAVASDAGGDGLQGQQRRHSDAVVHETMAPKGLEAGEAGDAVVQHPATSSDHGVNGEQQTAAVATEPQTAIPEAEKDYEEEKMEELSILDKEIEQLNQQITVMRANLKALRERRDKGLEELEEYRNRDAAAVSTESVAAVAQQEPSTVKPEPAKQEPVAAKPEPVKPEPVVVKPEPVQQEPVAAKQVPVAAKPEPVKPEPVAVKPEPVQQEPVAVKPEPVKPEPVAVKPEPAAVVNTDGQATVQQEFAVQQEAGPSMHENVSVITMGENHGATAVGMGIESDHLGSTPSTSPKDVDALAAPAKEGTNKVDQDKGEPCKIQEAMHKHVQNFALARKPAKQNDTPSLSTDPQFEGERPQP